MARKNDKIATVQGTFIGERVKDLAVMYLTRRSDLELKWQDSSDEWVDCIVEIKGKEKPARRLFGVELSGTMSPVTDEHANKVLYPKMQSMLRRGKFPFPVCLLYFTMANNEGRFAWVAEPVLESAKPVLEYHEQADTKKLDKVELDKIVGKINNWFDAMDADSCNVSCGECGTVLYDEPADHPLADRKPCPRCGSTKRAFSVQASVNLNLSAALSARASVIDYPESLLNTASGLIRRELYDAAVLMAHQACEIATERTIARALSISEHQFAPKIDRALSSGNNLANEQIRKLYTLLTGDDIQRQSFWPQFEEFVALRNEVVQSKKSARRSDAEAALVAAGAMIDHLRRGSPETPHFSIAPAPGDAGERSN
jgi:rubrerythrin